MDFWINEIEFKIKVDGNDECNASFVLVAILIPAVNWWLSLNDLLEWTKYVL